ncbi:MAG: fimbrillin family protein [Prevotella sp.]|nr:fimbrillin family protein [Prevotella sp.]
MKKIFLIGLTAAAMLASCSNDETVEMAQQKAISFSNAFVNNGTRSVDDPSFTTLTLKDFAVYGFTQKGQIFNGEKVSKGGTASTGWSYNNVQYWVPGNTYTFGAIAPHSVAGNVSNVTLPTGATKVEMEVAFTNKDADQVDLLHAAPTQITGVTATYTTPVSMTFNHQLSKVKFSFQNSVGEGYNVKVSNVKITDAFKEGTLTVAAAGNTWGGQTNKNLELNFGNVVADASTTEASVIANAATLESYNEKLMIPMGSSAIYTVTFTAELFKDNVSLGIYNHRVEIKNVEFKLGYCYDFKASLTHKNITAEDELNPIEFAVTKVEDWNKADIDKDLNVPTTQSGI